MLLELLDEIIKVVLAAVLQLKVPSLQVRIELLWTRETISKLLEPHKPYVTAQCTGPKQKSHVQQRVLPP